MKANTELVRGREKEKGCKLAPAPKTLGGGERAKYFPCALEYGFGALALSINDLH